MTTFNKSKTFELNPSKRFVGVEIEIAYIDFNKKYLVDNTIKNWNGVIGIDGSIDGRKKYQDGRTDANLEIKTAPTNGDLFIKQMMELGNSFKESKATANNTCGVHVHIDARDLKDADIEKVLSLWYKVEKPMFSIISPRRLNGNWCKPWNFNSIEPEELKAFIVKNDYYYSLYNKKIKLKTDIVNNNLSLDRYKSLNLCSLSSHGTLENRMHHGSTNATHIINWAILNASMVDYAKKHTLDEIKAMRNGWWALYDVAPHKAMRNWLTRRRNYWIDKEKNKKDESQNL